MTLKYFAYGSNMSSLRISARVPSARVLARARLDGYRLAFHKRGIDGSGKCDAVSTGDVTDAVHGVLYRIAPRHRADLDRAEGLGVGYRRETVNVVLPDGGRQEAFTYCALLVDEALRPFGWYLQHVLRGAKEHGLPERYRAALRSTLANDDPDRARAARELSVYAPR